MMHLLRSLFVGYFVAVSIGTIAIVTGFDPLMVVLVVWLGGSTLSVAIAASVSPIAEEDQVLSSFANRSAPGNLHADLTARELALWDADMASERFEADLMADDMSKDASSLAADAVDRDRKTG